MGKDHAKKFVDFLADSIDTPIVEKLKQVKDKTEGGSISFPSGTADEAYKQAMDKCVKITKESFEVPDSVLQGDAGGPVVTAEQQGVDLETPVKLCEVKYLGQAVRATSSGSVYYTKLITPRVALAARLITGVNNTYRLSLRIEPLNGSSVALSQLEDLTSKMKFNLSDNDGTAPYMSTHLDGVSSMKEANGVLGCVIGVILATHNTPMDKVAVDLTLGLKGK